MLLRIFKSLLALPLLFIVWHTLIRIIRHYYKFPIPEFLADLIDNPLRRKFMPPDETAIRHGIQPGMEVLEVGPGNGRYTVAAARRVGVNGKVTAIDIEPKMIQRLIQRASAEQVANIEARVADVYRLPFDDASFDLAVMITVTGEIPDLEKALKELHRVLKPRGALVCSEVFMDPDYPLARTLTRRVTASGFQLSKKIGNFFYYTLIFAKV